MSVSSTGRHIRCDGEECEARAEVPVALRPMLARDTSAEAEDGIGGWLFVARHGERRHYCPACSARYLDGFGNISPEM